MGEEVIQINREEDIPAGFELIDIFDEQLTELAEIRNPAANSDKHRAEKEQLSSNVAPVIVVYPWRKKAIRTVPRPEYLELKTNRNQLLITANEQLELLGARIAIAGMSVGSSLLYGLVGTGIGGAFTIADDDSFSTTNLNRVQATILDVGRAKVTVAKERMLELNPFVKVNALHKKLDDTTLDEFFMDGEADIVFEEIDDFHMKLRLREKAKELKVPLVMLTNLSDNVMIDIERYDSQPETEPFNGLVSSELIEKMRAGILTKDDEKMLARELVDMSLIEGRALQSLAEMGKTLAGRPQLYGTVSLDSGIAPYVARRILLDASLPSGRYKLRLGELF